MKAAHVGADCLSDQWNKKSLESWITSRQIEAARIAVTRFIGIEEGQV
jgi:ribosomal protein L16/L10AE